MAAAAKLDASAVQITRTDSPKAKLPKEKLTFGTTFSDHMLEIDWAEGKGWGTPKIHPYQSLSIDPAASVLHYALECFEGMKAYKDGDGKARLFRPNKNMERMNNSMRRLHLPTFEGDQLQELIAELVRVDKDWIPDGEGFSLYIRPTGISTHNFLGVGPAKAAKIFVILSPVGPYYPEGFAAVTLFADNHNTRAWPGGTGDAKVGGNYGPTISPQMQAAQKGYSQVLWLFGDKHEVTEVGTMNMFVHWINEDGEKELVTAPLDGTILPGVTRDSILHMARNLPGVGKVSERKYFMPELAKACNEGRVLEAFGCGTAAVVSPIKLIHWDGTDYHVPVNKETDSGPLCHQFWDDLVGIQYGRLEGPEGWSVVID